jgi:DNA-directed RNA polymerase specialized sigma subunit
MTSKEYLSQVYHLELKIKQLKIRSKEFERLSNTVPGSNYDGVRVDGTRNQEAPYVKWIVKKSEVDNKIATLQKDVERLKVEILQVIEKLENEDHKNVLIMRYLDTQTWEKIAESLYCSISTVKRWHFAAISKITL